MKNTKHWKYIRDQILKKIYYHLHQKPFHYYNYLNGVKHKFYIDNFHAFLHATSYHNWEKDTCRFIMEHYKPGDVVYDIGANMGVFSLYSIQQRCRLFAFEPHPGNYTCLQHNMEINKTRNIDAYCIAISNITGFNSIKIRDDIYCTISKEGTTGCICFTMDDVVKSLPFPIHVKIDVDGNERDILEGMKQMLKDMRLKTLIVELCPVSVNMADAVICEKMILDAGFKLIDVSSGFNNNHFYVKGS